MVEGLRGVLATASVYVHYRFMVELALLREWLAGHGRPTCREGAIQALINRWLCQGRGQLMRHPSHHPPCVGLGAQAASYRCYPTVVLPILVAVAQRAADELKGHGGLLGRIDNTGAPAPENLLSTRDGLLMSNSKGKGETDKTKGKCKGDGRNE